MAALTAARNTTRHAETPIDRARSIPVKGAKKIYEGALVAIDATGLALPAATATGLKPVGRALKTADNSAGADSAISVEVDQGTFKFNNSTAGDAIAQADVGNVCFAVDDNTVAKTDGSGARSPAGVIVQVDSDGVWIETRLGIGGAKSVDQGGTGATSLTAHGLLVGEGTSPVAALAVATDGQLVIGQSAADPAPKTVSGDMTIDKNGVTTIGANKVTGTQLSAGAQRFLMAAAGAAAPGAVTLTGAKVGDTVTAVQNFTTGAMQAAGDFEAIITVANQIQQITASDLHLDKLTVFLVAKS